MSFASIKLSQASLSLSLSLSPSYRMSFLYERQPLTPDLLFLLPFVSSSVSFLSLVLFSSLLCPPPLLIPCRLTHTSRTSCQAIPLLMHRLLLMLLCSCVVVVYIYMCVCVSRIKHQLTSPRDTEYCACISRSVDHHHKRAVSMLMMLAADTLYILFAAEASRSPKVRPTRPDASKARPNFSGFWNDLIRKGQLQG